MCRKLVLVATTVMAMTLPQMAAHAANAADSTAKTPAPATAGKPAPPAAAKPAPQPPRKATAAERAQADRLDPLSRAAFWAHEVNVDSADAVAGVKLASALRALGQFPQAAQAAQQVLVSDPNNFDALIESARAYVAAGQGFYAIAPLQHAQTLAPKDWRPLSLLGVAYSEVRRDDDAQDVWRQALRLSPENPAVLSNMAMAMAGQGDIAGAESLLRRAVAQPGASLQERQNLTLVLGLQGKLTEAEKRLRQDLPPDQADADLAYLEAVSSRGDAAGHSQPVPATGAAGHTWESLHGAGG
jgi:Flp pilus assembly protein TadD